MSAVVQMRGITKAFGDVRALNGVDLDLRAGEVHALLGENGAGKTTLMNSLYGLLHADSGSIAVDGAEVRFRSPTDAIASGVGMVHQHFKLVPTLTVAENMLLGRPGGPLLRDRDRRAVAERLTELGDRYGLPVDPEDRVGSLSVGQQQRVEILRALYRDAKVLILDEPTATLTPPETDRLFPKLRALAKQGTAIVFITHHLNEVLAWADRITVLRRGELADTRACGETSAEELARLMVGRDIDLLRVVASDEPVTDPSAPPPDAVDPVLAIRGLTVTDERGITAVEGVDLEVAPGEVLAIAGVEGNGQTELEETLFGLRAPAGGTVTLDGTEITAAQPLARMRAGLGLVPSDRYRRGLVADLSVADNLVLDRIGKPPFGTRLRLDRKAVDAHATELIERYSIRVSGPSQRAGTLSGGNAQRVVLARALDRDLRCLIAAQPTRGLDVGAIEFVWEQLAAARDRGVAILLISTELDEAMRMADRCAVLYRGRLVQTWSRAELNRERIGLAMGGGGPATADTPAEDAAA